MATWFLLISFLIPSPAASSAEGAAADVPDDMRYRGIEQLFAKFEAEHEAGLGVGLGAQNR